MSQEPEAPRRPDLDPSRRPDPSARAARFEDRLRDLEAILGRLERGDLSLDDSVAEYEKGIAALRACREVLAAAEKRIEEIVRSPDAPPGTPPLEPRVVPFEPGT